MATPAHCVACFEALDGNLNARKPLSLDEIQSKWEAYASSQAASSSNRKNAAALGSLAVPAGASTGTSSSSLSSTSSSTPASAAASTPATSISSLPLSASYPLFVTWNTYDDDADPDDEDVSLRGCIGTFESMDLHAAVPEYALISALSDHRFSPISKAELPTLQTAVTLLTDFEPVADPYDWEVGTHGIRLSFQDRGRRYGATYLPDVASEQGWTKEETLFSLVRKAGWMGSQSRFKEMELGVTRYQGSKAKMGYGEYKQWRDWVESK